MKIPQPAALTITELRRAGDGTFEDTPVVFLWTSAEHASAQGDVDLHLMVKTVRREIPGSNTVVEQAMSATWQPFTLQGEWDDKWGNRRFPSGATLSRSGAYALETFREFAKLVTRMPLVRVELDALSFIGLLTDLKVAYRTQTYIKWTATVSPHQNDMITVERTKTIAAQSLPKMVEEVATTRSSIWFKFDSIMGAIQSARDRVTEESRMRQFLSPLSFKIPLPGGFTKTLLEIDDGVARLQGIIEDGFHVDTEAKLLLIASTFRRIRAASKSGVEFLKNSQPDDSLAFDDALEEMRYKEWVAASVELFWIMVGQSRASELDVRRRVKQKPRAIYYPKAGESLERISLMFYGTADNWRAIYDKNNLDSLNLDGTEELVIPERGS